MPREENRDFDPFVSNKIYTDAASVFNFQPRKVTDIKDTALIVLDTNALLVPYNTGKESLLEIERTYRNLVNSKRLIIPGQVAREFADNRAEKIKTLYQQLSLKKSEARKFQKGSYPLLESLAPYQHSRELEKQLDSLIESYKETISDILDHISDWTWNDPVSQLYRQLFTADVVSDIQVNEKELLDELDMRFRHRIPPGYKDSRKDDRGIGDLLIWHSILNIAVKHKSDVIFVSGDKKTDWRYQSDNKALYPRYELIQEFREKTDGRTFCIIEFSEFLQLYGADKEVVSEVKDVQRLGLEVAVIESELAQWLAESEMLKRESVRLRRSLELIRDQIVMLEQDAVQEHAYGDDKKFETYVKDIEESKNLQKLFSEEYRQNQDRIDEVTSIIMLLNQKLRTVQNRLSSN